MPRAKDSSRYWTFMFYNDHDEYSAFVQEINDLGLLCALSPLHDKDIDPKSDTGQLKKAHTHVVLKFPHAVGHRAVNEITQKFQGATDYVQRILNPAKMVEYLTHENQPEKHHYNIDDVTWLNGATMDDFPDEFQLNKKERREQEEIQNLMELLQIIDTVAPKSIKDLSRWCVENNRPDLLRLIFKNSYYFDRVLKTVSTPDAE